MENKGLLTKILVIAGTGLAWLPILAPIFFSLAGLISNRQFRFDYLMPAELFPSALVGGGLLLWGALRAQTRRRLIAWAYGATAGLLVGGQGLAVLTGLASGETEPVGWRLTLVIASIAGYTLALIVTGVGGALLLRDLFQPARLPGGNRQA